MTTAGETIHFEVQPTASVHITAPVVATGSVVWTVSPTPVVKTLKILLIGPTVFKLPLVGYGGTEAIILSLVEEFQKAGHQVTVVAPEGSELPQGVTLFPVPLRCSEEEAFSKYRSILPEFDIIHDHTFESWAYLESVGVDPPLPIIKTHHTDPSIWPSPPPVPHPCLVGISTDHARRLSLAYGVATRRVYDGLDLNFYSPPPEGSKRNGRLLWLGRYTPEKDPQSAMQLAKRLRMPLDCYGDTQIVAGQEYVDRCRAEADGLIVRWYPGVTREKTVELYRTYRALLYTPAWCLTPDTPVIGNPSAKPIEAVRVGDQVINAEGQSVVVKWAGFKHYAGPMIRVTPHVLGFPVQMTPEHCVYTLSFPDWARPSFASNQGREQRKLIQEEHYRQVTSLAAAGLSAPAIIRETHFPVGTVYAWTQQKERPRASQLHYIWKRAGDLKVGDWIGFPIHRPELVTNTIDCHPREESARPGVFKRKWNAPEQLPITDKLLWLVGLYVAEGFQRVNGLGFGLGSHETALIQQCHEAIKEIFGAESKNNPRNGGNEVYVSSAALAELFKSWVPSGAWQKCFPEWAVAQEGPKLAALIRGYWEGDGYERKANGYTYYGMSTVSQTLAFQLVNIILRQGIIPVLRTRIQGPNAKGAGNTIYSIEIAGDRQHFASWLGLPQPTGGQGGHWHSKGFILDNCLWMRIRKIEQQSYSGLVHDIQTSGSFVAGPMIVHNSEPFGLVLAEAQACGMPVLTLDRGSMKELVADGVSGYVCDDISGLEQMLKDGCLASIKAEDCVNTAARFSKETMAQEYLRLFEQITHGGTW